MLTRSAMKRRPRNTGPSHEVVDVVLARANYSCEIAGCAVGDRRGVDYSLHHRRPRGMGGSHWSGINLPSNIMLLCGSGTTGCHSIVETRRAAAVAAGWLVLSRTDPATVPCLIEHGSRFVYLTASGEYSDSPPEAAV